ncbi:radial spoke head containing protein [Stylonychia lemnae]|uniref:Radial spoke head containing protein n=1 Tax=Stylonychia lemnae TaxID=5949 RepID=A0A078A7P9_STYLE|nr:radial spoke head containing protein [Stylonychia lemnae]|eukprot:CDW76811.1 radial spoke head containing protein [Stylonychia lemnae]
MGIELIFIVNKDKLNQSLMTCSLCYLIFVNPVLCKICHNHFCQMCLQKYLKDNDKKCPVDKTILKADDILKPAPQVQQQLEEVQINCQLCSNIFKLKEIESHVKKVHLSGSDVNSNQNSLRQSRQIPEKSKEKTIGRSIEDTIKETLGTQKSVTFKDQKNVMQSGVSNMSGNIQNLSNQFQENPYKTEQQQKLNQSFQSQIQAQLKSIQDNEPLSRTMNNKNSLDLRYSTPKPDSNNVLGIKLAYNKDRDSPLKIERTVQHQKEKFFENIKPNIYTDMLISTIATQRQHLNNSALLNMKSTSLSRNMDQTLTSDQLQQNQTMKDNLSLLSSIKYDSINDKISFIERKQKRSQEKEKLRNTSHYVSQLSYHGVIPDDQYITLPRIMYNLPEKNPHLSNQRVEGGRVNVRSFKIQKFQNDLLKSQFQSSLERAGFTDRNMSEGKQTNGEMKESQMEQRKSRSMRVKAQQKKIKDFERLSAIRSQKFIICRIPLVGKTTRQKKWRKYVKSYSKVSFTIIMVVGYRQFEIDSRPE